MGRFYHVTTGLLGCCRERLGENVRTAHVRPGQVGAGRQVKPPVPIEANTEQTDLIIRVDRHLKLFGQNERHKPNGVRFYLGQAASCSAVAMGRGSVTEARSLTGTLPCGSACRLAGGFQDFAKGRCVRCSHGVVLQVRKVGQPSALRCWNLASTHDSERILHEGPRGKSEFCCRPSQTAHNPLFSKHLRILKSKEPSKPFSAEFWPGGGRQV